MYYKWIQVPKCGEVYTGNLRIVMGFDMPTVHDKAGTYFSSDWLRIEEEPEVDVWFFENAPIRALAVKTIYRNAWTFTQWIKLFP